MQAVTHLCDSYNKTQQNVSSLQQQARVLGIEQKQTDTVLPPQKVITLLAYDAQVLHIVLLAGEPKLNQQGVIHIDRTSIECTRKWVNFAISPSFASTIRMCEIAFLRYVMKSQQQNNEKP